MKRFEFNKLVRNKLPPRMEQENLLVNAKQLTQTEYLTALKNKLLEEVQEVVESSALEDLKKELADVFEVLYTLADSCGLSIADIEAERQIKASTNGVFDSKSYINHIEVPLENQQVIDYLLNKNRPYEYREVKD